MAQHEAQSGSVNGDRISLGAGTSRLFTIAGGIGLGCLILTMILAFAMGEGAPTQFAFSYLVNFCFFLSVSLGALIFVALQHLVRAGWSVVVRRIAELLAGNLILMAVLLLPVLLSMKALYHWTDAEYVAHDPILQGKTPYLNIPFFLVRCVLYFGIWIWLSRFFLDHSTQQDKSGDVKLTLSMEGRSAPAVLLFFLTASFASYDLIMSLNAHWFSTIFGVYFMGGCMVAIMSTLALVALILQRAGLLAKTINTEHYHDLGKFLFGFVFFWGYIAFSQYMLIWYANIPETTPWFLVRQEGGWFWVAITLVFGHFFIPFLGLLSRHVKRCRFALAFWAMWVLVMHWLDLYWLIMPEHSPDAVPFGLLDVGCFIGIGGIYVAGFIRLAQARALVPVKDPRLSESLAFKNI